MGIGSITFSLPHFLAGNYMLRSDLNTSNDNICRVPNHGDGANPLLEQLPALDKIKTLTQGQAKWNSDQHVRITVVELIGFDLQG